MLRVRHVLSETVSAADDDSNDTIDDNNDTIDDSNDTIDDCNDTIICLRNNVPPVGVDGECR